MPEKSPRTRQVRLMRAARRCLLPLLAAALATFIAPGAAAAAAAPTSAQPCASPPDLPGSAALQQAEWLDPDAAIQDYFGGSLAVSGDTALVSAWRKGR